MQDAFVVFREVGGEKSDRAGDVIAGEKIGERDWGLGD